MTTERWEAPKQIETRSTPGRVTAIGHAPGRMTAIGRGLIGLCPMCGKGKMFQGFLRVASACRICAAPLGRAPADDAPPYFTILIVAHIIVPLAFMVDRSMAPPMWVMMTVFPLLTVVMALGLLRPIKGATVGLMLALNMLNPGESPAS